MPTTTVDGQKQDKNINEMKACVPKKVEHNCAVLNSKGISDSLLLTTNLAETLDSKYRDFHITKACHSFVTTALDEVVALENDLSPFSKCPSSVNRVLNIKASGLHGLHSSIGVGTRVRVG